MSVRAITVPDMEDLTELAASVTGFAAAETSTIVPAVPQHDCGPEVCLGPCHTATPRGHPSFPPWAAGIPPVAAGKLPARPDHRITVP
jgi:hypothetical protein